MGRHHLSFSTLTIFTLPSVLQGFMHVPANSVVQGVYAKEFGLDVAAIGTALLVAKLFDAVTDPLIGVWSDRYYTRGGSRKPFVVGGCFVTALGVWFLYNPHAGVGISWYLTWYLVAYFGWTVTEIPYRAWSLELSSDYDERSKIQGWLAMGLLAGVLLFYAIPFAAQGLGFSPNTEVTSQTLSIAALITLLGMPLVYAAAARWVPNGARHVVREGVPRRDSLRQTFTAICGNWPFLYVILMFVIAGLAGGISQSLAYFFIVVFLEIPDKFALVVVAGLPLSLVTPAIVAAVSKRFQRHRVLAVLSLLGVASSLYLALVIQPGPDSFIPMTLCMASGAIVGAGIFTIVPALIGDSVDYGILHEGQDRAGTFFAFYTLINKTLAAVGSGLGLLIIGYYGFDASAETQSPDAQWAMRLTYGWAPAIAFASTIPLAWFFPLGRAEHEEIVRQIAEREAALEAGS